MRLKVQLLLFGTGFDDLRTNLRITAQVELFYSEDGFHIGSTKWKITVAMVLMEVFAHNEFIL